jgi:hypothetical protein
METKFKNWIWNIVIKIIAIRLVHSENRLTPEYLLSKGWVMTEGINDRVMYVEPNIKDRDLISISFEHHYYRVWHSKKETFIALESTIEWFELYYLLAHPDNGRYEIANI